MAFLLHQLLSEAAHRDPARTAVSCRGETLTYGELEAAANGLASNLIAAGVQPGDRVGIHLPKRIETLVALYGTMKSGAAYVPLDPKAPPARLATISADCGLHALVTSGERGIALLSSVDGDAPKIVVHVDDGGSSRPEGSIPFEELTGPSSDPSVSVIDGDLAYILYTSGSTGTPKGVMLSHRHALNFVRWSASAIDLGPDDRFSNHAPLHFDLSIFDLYVAAHVGATVVLVPDEHAYFGAELAAFAEQESISVWYSVPSALMLLVRALDPATRLPDLRTVVFAGEVYPTPELRRLRERLPDVDLWNLYGPTETNVCTYYHVGEIPDDHVSIPIGKACENTEVFALREDGQIAGVGEEGELLVRGDAVMAGYWGRPDKTAEVVVSDPRPFGLGDRVYRTGDLVRLRPNGDYDFLGRRDHQIKSRGYRIELGDIEAALGASTSVLESAAVAVPHQDWGNAIFAWVVPAVGTEVSERAIRQHVARLLPRYMVPARVQVVESLPRTANGKIDRRLLTELAVSTPVG